jgi:hypothetical protein
VDVLTASIESRRLICAGGEPPPTLEDERARSLYRAQTWLQPRHARAAQISEVLKRGGGNFSGQT